MWGRRKKEGQGFMPRVLMHWTSKHKITGLIQAISEQCCQDVTWQTVSPRHCKKERENKQTTPMISLAVVCRKKIKQIMFNKTLSYNSVNVGFSVTFPFPSE